MADKVGQQKRQAGSRHLDPPPGTLVEQEGLNSTSRAIPRMSTVQFSFRRDIHGMLTETSPITPRCTWMGAHTSSKAEFRACKDQAQALRVRELPPVAGHRAALRQH